MKEYYIEISATIALTVEAETEEQAEEKAVKELEGIGDEVIESEIMTIEEH